MLGTFMGMQMGDIVVGLIALVVIVCFLTKMGRMSKEELDGFFFENEAEKERFYHGRK